MALLDEILKWSQTDLKGWQQDALRRLFAAPKGGLAKPDIDDLYALLKAAHGLPNPAGLAPVPLGPAHLPTNTSTRDLVVLKAMHSTKHLNRLAAGQTLEFAKSGLTTIFGGNGSGKSGYARGLKRACRARDNEPVHGDATGPLGHANIPEAKFDIEVGGLSKTVLWKRDATPPEELSTIAVFDSHCARVYLTEDQEAAYAPFGLSFVEDLGNKVLPALADQLAAEIRGISVDSKPFVHLLGATPVGKLIADLNHKTDVAEIRKLGTLGNLELNRLEDLERILAEADPKATAATIRAQAKRLGELVERLDKAANWVKDESVARLRALVGAAVSAFETERVAAENFRAGENLLPGTGETVWKELFEAARRYSEHAAYKDHAFPHAHEAKCVLCQQTLTDGADRLLRFDAYVKADAAKSAAAARKARDEGLAKIAGALLAVDMADSVRTELEALEPGLTTMIETFEAGIEARRIAMIESAKCDEWTHRGIPFVQRRS